MTLFQKLFSIGLCAMALNGPVKANADERQWHCTGYAYGSHRSSVDVTLFVTASGSVVGTSASWEPPITAQSQPVPQHFASPTISILFLTRSKVLVREESLLASASSSGGPKLSLRGKKIRLVVDTDDPMILDLPDEGVGPDYLLGGEWKSQRSVVFDNAMLLDKLKSAATATVSLIDRTGNEIGSTSYDLTAVEDRDKLFSNAWKDAESQSLQPKKCTATR